MVEGSSDKGSGIRASSFKALPESLWVQVELPEVKKDGLAETGPFSKAASLGFQLLNATVDIFGESV